MSNKNNHYWQLARATVLSPVDTSCRQFFFSRNLLETATNVWPAYAPVTKLGVLLEGNSPWEQGGANRRNAVALTKKMGEAI